MIVFSQAMFTTKVPFYRLLQTVIEAQIHGMDLLIKTYPISVFMVNHSY
jgi:hypothetical protein